MQTLSVVGTAARHQLRGKPSAWSRHCPPVWLRKASRWMISTILLLCYYLCPGSNDFWLFCGGTSVPTASASPSRRPNRGTLSKRIYPYNQLDHQVLPPVNPESLESAEGEFDGLRTAVLEPATTEPFDISEELEAAKRQAFEEYLNPLEEKLKVPVSPAAYITREDVGTRIPTGQPLLAVFTASGCQMSEEAAREARIAQPLIHSHGGFLEVAIIVTEREPELTKSLGITVTPVLRLYRDGNLKSTDHTTYDGKHMTATEIAYWVLAQENAVVRYGAEERQPLRGAELECSPVGPIVYASVHRGGQHAELVEQLVRNRSSLPSRFTLFNIQYISGVDKEELQVCRQEQPFDVGEEMLLRLENSMWEPESISALLKKAESRNIFYGEEPALPLLGSRVVLSVYVSQYQNLQDIAWLLMEFQPTYKDRIAFHIAHRTMKMASRSEDIFSHTWGGAVLTTRQANEEAYQRTAGVFREEVPFAQYALPMPFNYHNMKAFLEEWQSGKLQLHFRSNRYSYIDHSSPVMELNHAQLLGLLHKPDRMPLGILYYESTSPDSKQFLSAWNSVAKAFSKDETLKGQILFGQVNGLLNDLIDFDLRRKLPSIAVYPPGPKALDRRVLYTGPPTVEMLGNFMAMLRIKRQEL